MGYASTRTYDGRVAYITAPVVVRTEVNGLGAGVIDSISSGDAAVNLLGEEELWICEIGEGELHFDLVFYATATVADIDRMPAGCWTWPIGV